MTPININATRFLWAPPNWDADKHGVCAGLPIVDAHGHMYSYWKPSFMERLRVLVGIPVRLAVVSDRHPPVMIEVTK